MAQGRDRDQASSFDNVYDALDYMGDLPSARHHRHRRRQQHIAEAPQHPERGPHKGPTGKSSAALRHPRKKKGKYFAA